jgi:hypothetical protein
MPILNLREKANKFSEKNQKPEGRRKKNGNISRFPALAQRLAVPKEGKMRHNGLIEG